MTLPDISANFITKFNTDFLMLSQQLGSKVSEVPIPVEMVEGERATFDAIYPTTAYERTSRFGDTQHVETHHRRRVGVMRYATWSELCDRIEMMKIHTNPQHKYLVNGVNAIHRKIDDFFFSAYYAPVTELDGETTSTVTFPSANIVTSEESGGYSTYTTPKGMTVAKIMAAKDIFAANDVDLDYNKPYCFVTSNELNDLACDDRIANSLYSPTQPFASAKRFSEALGVRFIETNRLPTTTETIGGVPTTVRRCPFFIPNGIQKLVWDSLRTEVSKRDDKNYAAQLWAEEVCNFLRVEDEKCLEIRSAIPA